MTRGGVLAAAWAGLLLGGLACKRSAEFGARDLCVELEANVTASPPRIALSWPSVPLRDTGIVVRRKVSTATSFPGPPKVVLAAGATSWVDEDVELGVAYDYFVERTLPEGVWQ